MADSTNIECARLHAAYAELRREMSQPHYQALMEAFENDLRGDAFAYLPVADENVKAMLGGGAVKWPVLLTPKGKMLPLFTSKEEAGRQPSGNPVGVKLSAFVRAAMSIKECVGILINPFDGHHGVPVERRNLEVLVGRVAGPPAPRLHPRVVSDAVFHLLEIAVGVPATVYDVSKEVAALGGVEKLLGPILAGWDKRAKTNPGDFPAPFDYLKAVLEDVVSRGFVYGAMARKNPELALQVDIDRCIDAIPDLRSDIGQNVNEYLTLLSDAARSDQIEPNEEQLQLLLALNVGIIAFGAFNFGLGWGIAKNAESEGEAALAELRDRQQEWFDNYQARAREMQQQAENGEKDDEDGE